MAQWLGQFTGRTHATKVEDVEDSLRHAIASFRTADSDDRRQKSKSVRMIAERLLTARLKALDAKLAELKPAAEEHEQNAKKIQYLRAKESKARNEGVAGILREFRALDAIE